MRPKQLTAALQAQIVPAQVAMTGERRRGCVACGRGLASKGHYPAKFRSLFGDVSVRIRRLLVCPCQGPGEAKSFAALDLGKGAVAPELAYVTAKFAALAPFGKVATLLSELLPISGAQNAGTVRNRTLRVGEEVVPQHSTGTAKQPSAPAARPVVVGLDGGYVRSRHRPERRFESPRQLMAYLGLVPCESSTGERVRRGSITKAGNTRVRRVLIEGAWTYRFPARMSRLLQERQANLPQMVRTIAWKAQVRLCARYRRLMAAGKRQTVVTTAIAREMAAFLWAIGHAIEPRSAA